MWLFHGLAQCPGHNVSISHQSPADLIIYMSILCIKSGFDSFHMQIVQKIYLQFLIFLTESTSTSPLNMSETQARTLVVQIHLWDKTPWVEYYIYLAYEYECLQQSFQEVFKDITSISYTSFTWNALVDIGACIMQIDVGWYMYTPLQKFCHTCRRLCIFNSSFSIQFSL